MNSDLLTLLVGALGAVVSLATAAESYRRGKRASHVEKDELLAEIGAQRELLIEVVQRFTVRDDDRLQAALPEGEGTESAFVSDQSAVEVLVRAVLGTLLNERGEVAFQRLLHEVSHAVGRPSYTEIAEVLADLRTDGIVEWYPGPDLSSVDTIKVHARPLLPNRTVVVDRA